jgi:hypothetical protein
MVRSAFRGTLSSDVMIRTLLILTLWSALHILRAEDSGPSSPVERETRDIAGWQVRISRDLLNRQRVETERALELLKAQLDDIVRVVPPHAVAELRKVPLYVSPEYPGQSPTAEYHSDAGWLRAARRDPAMARCVEFSNVRIFEAEVRRMPVLALHELSHAYHDRVLGFDHAGIAAAYDQAKAGGRYDRVERQDSEGRKRMDRAYAMTDPREYFAECTEAFFGHNDFFPYTRAQLKEHDPAMFALLEKLWNPPANNGPVSP